MNGDGMNEGRLISTKLALSPADFYVGVGGQSTYLGSLLDAGPWNVVPSCFSGHMRVGDPGPLNPEINPIFKATSEGQWRHVVRALFERREDVVALLPEWMSADLSDLELLGIRNEAVWPWPWSSSAHTAWVYAWTPDGLVVTHYGRQCPGFREAWHYSDDPSHLGPVAWPMMWQGQMRPPVNAARKGGESAEGTDSAVG